MRLSLASLSDLCLGRLGASVAYMSSVKGRYIGLVMLCCLTGCGQEGDGGLAPLPKADMTEAYPNTPFRELHHPLPPYWGGAVPMVQLMQATPSEGDNGTDHTADGRLHIPPQTETDVSYGPRSHQK